MTAIWFCSCKTNIKPVFRMCTSIAGRKYVSKSSQRHSLHDDVTKTLDTKIPLVTPAERHSFQNMGVAALHFRIAYLPEQFRWHSMHKFPEFPGFVSSWRFGWNFMFFIAAHDAATSEDIHQPRFNGMDNVEKSGLDFLQEVNWVSARCIWKINKVRHLSDCSLRCNLTCPVAVRFDQTCLQIG